MKINAGQVISVAKKEVGTKEIPVNKTKYGKWYGLDGQPWCAMFVSWVFYKAGFIDLIDQTPKGFASCEAFEKWAKKNATTVGPNLIQPGDILLFDFAKAGKSVHTGIALGINPHTHLVDTVEGNTAPDNTGNQANGDGVYYKHRALSTIRCVVRPNWKE